MLTLRDYQSKAIDGIVSAFRNGRRGVILCCPTGGGKTVIFTEFIRQITSMNQRVAVMAHREELIKQAGRGLRICPEIGKTDCVIIDHGNNVAEHGHVMEDRAWTLYGKAAKDKKPPNPFRECEKCWSWYSKTLNACPDCGFVAVRMKMAAETLEAEFKEVALSRALQDPIVQEYKRLMRYAKANGKKPGWPFMAMRDKYGAAVANDKLTNHLTKMLQQQIDVEAKQLKAGGS